MSGYTSRSKIYACPPAKYKYTIIMSLNYYVTPNRISSEADDFMAVSVNRERYTIEDIYDYMTRQGSTLTKAEALAAFEEVMQGIVNIVEQGNSVVTPLVNIMPSISGVFDSEDDRFDVNRHKVGLSITPGIRLRETTTVINPQKVNARQRLPEPGQYLDNASDAENDTVTPLGGARIGGTLLKFDESDSGQGVFFVNTADGTENRADTPILRNKPSELIFMNPDLPAGSYRLEVRSIFDGSTEIRSGNLGATLTVA